MLNSPALSMPTVSGNTSVVEWWTQDCSWRTAHCNTRGEISARGVLGGWEIPEPLELYHNHNHNNKWKINKYIIWCCFLKNLAWKSLPLNCVHISCSCNVTVIEYRLAVLIVPSLSSVSFLLFLSSFGPRNVLMLFCLPCGLKVLPVFFLSHASRFCNMHL